MNLFKIFNYISGCGWGKKAEKKKGSIPSFIQKDPLENLQTVSFFITSSITHKPNEKGYFRNKKSQWIRKYC